MKTRTLFIPAVGSLLTVLAVGPMIFGEKDSRLGVETVEWLMSGDLGRGMGKPVTGAPFSAQIIIENTRALSNGVHLSEKATGSLYRDSQGRIRRDRPRDGEPEIAIIDDPVAGIQYGLHLFRHTATRLSYHEMEGPSNSEMKERRRGNNELAEKAERERPAGREKHEEISEPRVESLGSQIIEGVSAQGTRSTRMVPAGAMGNDKEFAIVQETWYSAPLQMVVLFKMSNPAHGDLVLRLANINQGEPSRSLFEPPSDFTLVEKIEGPRK